MAPDSTSHGQVAWLARVRHDLIKRLVWPARDHRDAGTVPAPGELVAALIDDQGAPVGAQALWAALAADAPPDLPLAPFEAALARALAAAQAGDVAGVLALEAAFDDLTRALAPTLKETSPKTSSPKPSKTPPSKKDR